MLKALEDGSWEEVFKYASPELAVEGDTVEATPFTREDVAKILAMEDGENDGPYWIMLGSLVDGRFFFISAGCDYTGWG